MAKHAAGDLGKPVIDDAEKREDRAPDEHVMKMSDHEKSVMHLDVNRDGGKHDPGKTAATRRVSLNDPQIPVCRREHNIPGGRGDEKTIPERNAGQGQVRRRALTRPVRN